MAKWSTKEKFIARSREVHGDKYDYSKVVYKGCDVKVVITCPIHGDFEQTPIHHTSGKRGCAKCSNPSCLLCGVGYTDIPNIRGRKFYEVWHGMIYRCYGAKMRLRQRNNTYNDCSVCEEWLSLSNFKVWFENPENGYQEGYQLDKDILVKGNKIYSPKTCCFVPQEINTLFHSSSRKRGKSVIGVKKKKSENIYSANICIGGVRLYLGSFKTETEAFKAYKKEKERYIRQIANEFYSKGGITKRVYEALMNYEVEIND